MINNFVHKYQKGSVLIVGSFSQPEYSLGAVVLAARASYRSGAGIVTVCLDKSVCVPAQICLPELVVADFGRLDIILQKAGAIVIGPGWFDESQHSFIEKILQSQKPLVVDAGALDVISKDNKLWNQLHTKCILTPHFGELARLMTNRNISSVEELLLEGKFCLIAKGPKTIVYNRKNNWQHDLANSKLAIAGSGDVLAGLIGGLWSQDIKASAFDIAKKAVSIHAQAGQLIDNGSLASELADVIKLIRRLPKD